MQDMTSDKKKYFFPYCLKNKHNQGQKSYICLEEQCQSQKHVCFNCFQEGNEHAQHQIIPSELLLKIAQQKILFPVIPQQIEKIDQFIEQSDKLSNAENLINALLQLKELLKHVVGFHQIKEYSIFQTNSIIELTYQLIAQNRYMRQIKQPHSLNLTEFELNTESVSSVLYIIRFEMEQLKKQHDQETKLIGFEAIQKRSETKQEDSSSYLSTPRKSYSQSKKIQQQPQSQNGIESTNNSTYSYMKTRSFDLPNDISIKQLISKPKNQNKEKQIDEQIEQEEPDTQTHIKDRTTNLKEIKYSPLSRVIQNYNKTDDIAIDTSKIQVVERAHQGIIYNILDLGEGSGNTFNQIVTMGEDGFMKFWNPSNLKCLHVIKLKDSYRLGTTIIRDIQYLKRIKCIAAISNQHIAIINIINYKVIKRIYVEANNLDSCDQLGQMFFVNPRNKSISIYNFFSFQQVGELPSQPEDITSLAYAKQGNKYYYFTGDKLGYLYKYDLEERKYLIHKKVNRTTIFYISTCRYNKSEESIITFCCNEVVKSSYIKIINIDNLDVIVNLNYSVIDSAVSCNNEIYLLQANNNIIQIIADLEIMEKKMSKVPSSFSKGMDVFNEGLRWIRSERVAILCQFTRTQHYSNLIKFPIMQQHTKSLNC